MIMKAHTIGLDIPAPKQACQDRKCPFHGELKVRGRIFTGTVVSDKMHRTVGVEWERTHFLPKFERYEKRKTSLKAHNPSCIGAKQGDIVTIGETRPLSKTKHFVVLQRKEGVQRELVVEEEMPEFAGQKKREKQAKDAEEAKASGKAKRSKPQEGDQG